MLKDLFEKFISKTENIGYKAANVAHRVAVTGLVVTLFYGTYALFRDYRSYFKMRKDPKYKEYIDKREVLIRELLEAKEKRENNGQA